MVGRYWYVVPPATSADPKVSPRFALLDLNMGPWIAWCVD